MRVIGVSAFLLSSLIALVAASGQTPPAADDPHHPTPEEGAPEPAAEGAAQDQATPTGDVQMGAMMSPEMMQMMMQMMAQHHSGGLMAMSGRADARPADKAGSTDLTPEAILGLGSAPVAEMTPELVQAWLQDRLDRLGNPRLKLGEIAAAADGSITAEIRTVDGSLVQKLAFNRFPGFVRQID